MKRARLNRKTPLRRGPRAELKRTPLRSGPLAHGKPPKRNGRLRRTRIRPVSDARRRENAARRKAVEEAWGTRPICCRCLTRGIIRPATDAHELTPRSKGGSITDPANIRPVCRACHDEIHANPNQAKAEGWLR